MNGVLNKFATMLVLILLLSTIGCDSDDDGPSQVHKKLVGIWACEYHWSPVEFKADGSGVIYYAGNGENIMWTYDENKSQIVMQFVEDLEDFLIIDIIEFNDDMHFKGHMYWIDDTPTDKIYTFERKEDLSFLEE